MIPTLLIVFYLSLVCWGLWRSQTAARLGLSPSALFAALGLKLAMGLGYGLVHWYYFQNADTFVYLEESNRIATTFFDYPAYYVRSLAGLPAEVPAGVDVFLYPNSAIFWKDFGTYALVHVHALLYPLTLGYYSVHIFLLALLGGWATLNFYRAFRPFVQLLDNWLFAICVLAPSLAFWTAGLHKDVWMYAGLSLVALGASGWMAQGGALSRQMIGQLAAGAVILAVFRTYALGLLLPAFAAMAWALRDPAKSVSRFTTTYALLLGAGILVDALLLGHRGLAYLADRQLAFLGDVGNSTVNGVLPFGESLERLVWHLPMAFTNGFLRPFIWEYADIWQFLAAAETLALWGLLILALCFPKTNALRNPFLLLWLFFAITHILTVGILVANEGTIVRYRAVSLGLLLLLFVQAIDFARVWALLRNAFTIDNDQFKTYP